MVISRKDRFKEYLRIHDTIGKIKQWAMVFFLATAGSIILAPLSVLIAYFWTSDLSQKIETPNSEVTCTVNEDLTRIEFTVPHIPDPENIPCSAYYSDGITETWEFKERDNEVVYKIIYDGSHYSLFIDKNQVTE